MRWQACPSTLCPTRCLRRNEKRNCECQRYAQREEKSTRRFSSICSGFNKERGRCGTHNTILRCLNCSLRGSHWEEQSASEECFIASRHRDRTDPRAFHPLYICRVRPRTRF